MGRRGRRSGRNMARRRHRPKSGCGGRGESRKEDPFLQAFNDFAEVWKEEKGTSPTLLDLLTYDEDGQDNAPRGRRRRKSRRKAAANA